MSAPLASPPSPTRGRGLRWAAALLALAVLAVLPRLIGRNRP